MELARWDVSSLRFAQGQALSAAKDLSPGQAQILRCAQDDSLWRPAPFKSSLFVRVTSPHA